MTAYKASPIRGNPADRKRLTGAEVQQLERQIYAALAECYPQSVRHVYYAMTDPTLPLWVPKGRVLLPDGRKSKNEPGYDCIQNRCVIMRENGVVPYYWFSDLSRRGFFTTTYDDAGDFLNQHIHGYRAHIWRDAESRCEIWCESRSIAGVIMADCEELAVDLYPTGGFTSKTLAYQAASDHNAVFRNDPRPLVILYIGDLDPAGKLIDFDLERELRKHLNPDIDLSFRRIAITPQQVELYDLPDKGIGEHRVEAEAMPASLMRKILRDEVERLLPSHALKVAKVNEESERNWLRYIAELRAPE